MILQRLYELAQREGLLDDGAFEEQPVPYVITVDAQGQYLGLGERRGETVRPGRKPGAAEKRTPDKGLFASVPRAHGNAANQGFARFFVDTLPRVLPVTDEEKSRRSRETFWSQIEQAAKETNDEALRAVQTFGRQLREDEALGARIRKDLEAFKTGPSDRCTFAYHPDEGALILTRPTVREWYRRFFTHHQNQQQAEGPTGLCQITGTEGPIPRTHPVRLNGIPGGLPTGVSIVSYDKAAFESYGLDGAANASIGYDAADGYCRALVALIGNRLPRYGRTKLVLAETLFLVWTRNPIAEDPIMALEEPTPELVEALMRSPFKGKESHHVEADNDFYLLSLAANSARAVVRDYLESPLPQVREHLSHWFRDLRIADTNKEGWGRPTSLFPLWQLAAATAREMNQVAPDVTPRLLRSAILGNPLPDSCIASCLARLRVEGSDGFRPARMALIKIFLVRRNIPVSDTLNATEQNPAYVCGRLMSVFEQIQYAALGDVNATVTDKFFGTFSAAPGVVLGRLFANAQNHLRKLRSEKPPSYVALDRRLTEVAGLFRSNPNEPGHLTLPQHQLSLIEQGLFALGYYHEKARQFEQIAERKAAKAAAETSSESQ